MKIKKIVLSLSTAVMVSGVFVGCGGGGGSGISTTQQAQLVDSNVSGVTYVTASGITGVTDTNGYFTYLSSDASVEFTIGGLTLANFDLSAINSDGKVLPTDLVGVDRNNTSNADVLKLLQTFQSLDDDGNATNGINITDTVKNSIVGTTNLTDMSLSELNTTVVGMGKTLKSEQESKAHHEEVLRDLFSLDIDTIAPSVPTITQDVNSTYQSAVTVEVNGEVGASIFVNGVDTALTIGTNSKKEISLSTNATTGNTNTFLITLKDSKGNISDDYNLTVSKISVPTPSDTIAPVFTSSASTSVDENQNSALTLGATDANSIAYTISGTDASAFSVNNSTGVVTFNSTPNYEIKDSYSFTAKASDGINDATQDITVSINNIVEPFITVWETTSSKQDITIPINSAYTYDYTVDWGDGTINSGLDTNATHTYSIGGNHTVKISGTFPTIQFNNSGDKIQINMISAWGDNVWKDFNSSFYGCTNLELNATDTPDLSDVTNMSGMFRGTSFLKDINDWNVSTITDMSYLFSRIRYLNTDISNWDVSNVTNMEGMFSSQQYFNKNISNWDVSNVTNMRIMFFHSYRFNQPLNNWNVSNVTNMNQMFSYASDFNQPLNNWDVSSVTNMGGIFFQSSFNQPLNNWNISNVTYLESAFGGTPFNQDISNWNVSQVTDMRSVFNNASSFTNQDLSGWDVGNVTIHTDFMSGAGTGNTEPIWP